MKNDVVQDMSVDVFKDQVLLDDLVLGSTVRLTPQEAIALGNRLIRAGKLAQNNE